MDFSHEALCSQIVGATKEVFATMLGTEIAVVRTALEQGGSGTADGVAALVGIAGTWAGTGCVSCGAELSCKLAQQMLMAEYTTVCDDVLDAMGEIANMVIGNIKTNLEEKLGPLGLSIPTVVYGRNFATRTLGKHEWTVVVFGADGAEFQVQMMLRHNAQTPTAPRHGYTASHPLT